MDEAERQRIRVKRRYYRTLDGISEARALVRQLTEQHHAAIERQQKHVLLQEQDAEELDQVQESRRALSLYMEASSLADRLRREKERLILLIQDREKQQHRVATLFDEFDGATHVITSVDVSGDSTVSFIPLSVEDCSLLVVTSYDRVQCFLQTQETLSIISTVFGWRKRRQNDAGVVKISITKTLENCAPFDLSLRTWEVLREPDEFAKLYSGSFRATMQCLQRVDDNNVVLYGQFNSSQHSVTFHCLFLVSWIKIDGGYAVLLQSVDRVRLIREAPEAGKSVVEGEEIAERWMELNQWFIFHECPEEPKHTNVTYGGILEGTSEADSQLWLIEMCLIALRWESRMVGQRPLVFSE